MVQKVGPAAEEEARQALERAAEHAAKGRYRRARDSFKRIVFHWPETRAGREAKRRLADNSFFSWSDVVRNGPAEARIDVVFLGEDLAEVETSEPYRRGWYSPRTIIDIA